MSKTRAKWVAAGAGGSFFFSFMTEVMRPMYAHAMGREPVKPTATRPSPPAAGGARPGTSSATPANPQPYDLPNSGAPNTPPSGGPGIGNAPNLPGAGEAAGHGAQNIPNLPGIAGATGTAAAGASIESAAHLGNQPEHAVSPFTHAAELSDRDFNEPIHTPDGQHHATNEVFTANGKSWAILDMDDKPDHQVQGELVQIKEVGGKTVAEIEYADVQAKGLPTHLTNLYGSGHNYTVEVEVTRQGNTITDGVNNRFGYLVDAAA